MCEKVGMTVEKSIDKTGACCGVPKATFFNLTSQQNSLRYTSPIH
jgi:hypothetical protein